MNVVFVPGGFRFSAHVDEAVEWALKGNGHSIKRLCRDCLHTIGQGALERVKADALITVHGRRFPRQLLREVDYPTVVWLVDEPQEVDMSEGYGKHFDIVITNDANTCGIHGPHKCWYLPLGADPRIHKSAPPDREVADVSLVGGVLPERASLLDQVYGVTSDFSWRIVGPDLWHKDVSFAEVWQRGCVAHEEYVALLRASRIVLDIPRNELVSFVGRTNRRGIPAMGVSSRVFEATACGKFLLTSDARGDIFRLFPSGSVGVYRHGDAAHLAHQIRYYLEHEEEREDMAQTAHQTCMAEHTYPVRVRQLIDIIEQWKVNQMPASKEKGK